jgi:iron complex outermembrane receptor protein
MKVKIGCYFIAFLANLCSFCYAQSGSSIRGTVFTQNSQPADAATVVLLNLPDSSVVMSALVNGKGMYKFLNLKPGSYVVLATRLGYKKTLSSPFEITAGQNITAGQIILDLASQNLKEVAIVAKKQYIEVRPGKLVINPGASIIADGQSVLEILRQSPGVRIDNNDNVSVNGRQDALILIDGKATNLTGVDLAALLKSTQGSNIDRMEVLTGGSAKYDAAAGGIINIIYKKGKNLGTNGTFNISAGYGRFYKASTGLSFNHRTKTYNIFGSYSFNANKTWKALYTNRNIDYSGTRSNYNTVYNSIQESANSNFRLGTDFVLSPNQSIGFLITAFVNNNDFTKKNNLDIIDKGVLDSTLTANSTIDRNITNINYNVNYTGKLDETGRTITANLTYTRSDRKSAEYITNDFYNAAGNTYRNPLMLQNLSPTKMNNWTGLLEYTNPLPKNAKLDAGLKLSRTATDNNLIFGPSVNGIYTVNSVFSNHFLFDESIGAAYLNYTGKLGKFDIDAGLRGEYTHNVGKSITNQYQTTKNYFNLFPTAVLSYRYNEKNQFSLSLTRGISRPTYDKLNPFLIFLDIYDYQSGNPYLMPEYDNTIKISHTYNEEMVTSIRANLLTSAAFPFYEQNDANKVNISTNVNLGCVYTYGFNVITPVKFTRFWTSTYDIDASYQRYVAYARYGNLNKGTGDFILQSTQSFTISNTIAAEISGRYETATFYGINNIRPNYFVGAGINKQILNKLGKISIAATDIFNTNQDRTYVNYQNLNLSMADRREYRRITLSFSYRFGKTSVKSAAKHITGSESEQSRMRLNN